MNSSKEDEPSRDVLNAAVTDAILHAEDMLIKAIKAWEKVAKLENELSGDVGNERDLLQQLIAARGYGMAAVRVDMLKAILGKKAGG